MNKKNTLVTEKKRTNSKLSILFVISCWKKTQEFSSEHNLKKGNEVTIRGKKKVF